MPVEDMPVHESTRHDSSRRYGCHNRPRRREPMMVKDGYTAFKVDYSHGPKSVYRLTEIKDFGSLECRYDKSLTDPACGECQHRGSGEEYSRSIHQKAAGK